MEPALRAARPDAHSAPGRARLPSPSWAPGAAPPASLTQPASCPRSPPPAAARERSRGRLRGLRPSPRAPSPRPRPVSPSSRHPRAAGSGKAPAPQTRRHICSPARAAAGEASPAQDGCCSGSPRRRLASTEARAPHRKPEPADLGGAIPPPPRASRAGPGRPPPALPLGGGFGFCEASPALAVHPRPDLIAAQAYKSREPVRRGKREPAPDPARNGAPHTRRVQLGGGEGREPSKTDPGLIHSGGPPRRPQGSVWTQSERTQLKAHGAPLVWRGERRLQQAHGLLPPPPNPFPADRLLLGLGRAGNSEPAAAAHVALIAPLRRQPGCPVGPGAGRGERGPETQPGGAWV